MELAHHFRKAAQHNRKLASVHDDMASVHAANIDSRDSSHAELQRHHTKLAKLHHTHAEHLAELAAADNSSKVEGDTLSDSDRDFLRKLIGIDDLNSCT